MDKSNPYVNIVDYVGSSNIVGSVEILRVSRDIKMTNIG
jgi:hypothetical protein